jgi:thiosulfate/3-mercaptopyruvate sulfurtransferase
MARPADPNPRLAQHAHPERLVIGQWPAENLGRGGLVGVPIVKGDDAGSIGVA